MANMFSNNAGLKARLAIIAIASLILVALMVVGLTVGISTTDKYKKNGCISPSFKAVDDICKATDYEETCKKTLRNAAPATDDPNELIKPALFTALQEISSIPAQSTPLKELGKDPKTAMAAQNCKQLLNDAADDLRRSMGEIGKLELSNTEKILSNLKVWLSATVTYQETCIDGFDNSISEVAEEMRRLLNVSMEMSSNGLAMVTAALCDLQLKGVSALRSGSRRLLEDPIPVWLDFEHRRQKLKDVEADVVVAQDGSGEFRKIGDAFKLIPMYGNVSFVIHVKEGVYKEHLTVEKWHSHVVLVGDGPTKTRITGDSSFVDGAPLSQTPTLSVRGDRFMAKHIGVENTAGSRKRYAVAVKVQSDQSIFYNCHFDGHQNTLHTHTYRQFYRDCQISGTVDFIFGDALAFFQNCTFLVRKTFDNEPSTVTAQGRKDRHQPTGIVMNKCKFTAHPDYYPLRSKSNAYLGRPSKEYSKTIIMESEIGDLINPDGWLLQGREFGLNTCYYGVYRNQGRRVKWAGVKTILDAQADKFMPRRFCLGDDWIRASGIPYLPVLSSSSESVLHTSLAKPPTRSPSEISSLMAILERALAGVPSEEGRSTMVNLERSLMQSNRDEIDQMKRHRILKDDTDPENGKDDDDDLNNNDDDENKPPPPKDDDDDDNADDDNDDHDRVVDPQKPSKMDSVLHKIHLKAGSDSSIDASADQSEAPSPSPMKDGEAPSPSPSSSGSRELSEAEAPAMASSGGPVSSPTSAPGSISFAPDRALNDLERDLMDDVKEEDADDKSDDQAPAASPSAAPMAGSAPAYAPLEGRSTRSISLPPEIGDLERELMDDVKRESVTAPSSDDSMASLSPESGSPSPSPAEDMVKGVHLETGMSSAPSSGSSSVISDLEKQLLNEDSKLEKSDGGDGDEVGSPEGGPAPSPESSSAEAEGPAMASSVSPSSVAEEEGAPAPSRR